MTARLVFAAALALCAGQAVAAHSAAAQSALTTGEATTEARVVHLRGLDVLAGQAADIDVPVGQLVRFGRLEIVAEACRVPRDDPTANAYAFLKIRDVREDAPRFSGWMFASSPALSALDHPRYDLWVVSCSNS